MRRHGDGTPAAEHERPAAEHEWPAAEQARPLCSQCRAVGSWLVRTGGMRRLFALLCSGAPQVSTVILGRRTCLFHPFIFLTAPRMVLPKILVLNLTPLCSGAPQRVREAVLCLRAGAPEELRTLGLQLHAEDARGNEALAASAQRLVVELMVALRLDEFAPRAPRHEDPPEDPERGQQVSTRIVG